MPIRVVRNRHPVDTRDAVATRAWLKDRIEEEVRVNGEPRPRLIRLDAEHIDTVDLTELNRLEPDAHVGATWEAMRAVPHDRRFLVMQLLKMNLDGTEERAAAVFEELVIGKRRRWWMALLPYRTDPVTNLGITQAWHDSQGETEDPRMVPPPFMALLMNSAGAKAPQLLPPSDRVEPDILTAYGTLRDGAATPTDAKGVADLGMELAVRELLTGAAKGSVVVKLVDRRWEQWVLSGELPAPLEEFIRYIANREETADGVALIQIAVRQKDRPPVPGLQVIAEYGGSFVECWGPVEFPEGAEGRKEVPRVQWWNPRRVPDDGMWIGVQADIGIHEPDRPEA